MADETAPQPTLEEINERLKHLEAVVRELASRVYTIEKRFGLTYEPPEPPRVKPPVKSEQPASPPSEGPPPAPVYSRVVNVQPPSPPASTTLEPKPEPHTDLETRIGGSWFNRIGVVAICLGVAFFLKYAFESGLIAETGRVLIGVAIGLGFLAGGELLRKRYANYAYGLSGGGILILYLSIFAAFARYHLIEHVVAFILMALVTAAAALLSARYSALPIAILGLIGGFLTPVLLSTGVDNQAGLFGYIALLDLGVLAVAYRKQWRVLNYLAFAGTVLMVIGWALTFWSEEKLWTTVFFLTAFFAIFALLAVFYNVINRRPTRWLDLALVFANALLYFGATYELLEDNYHPYLGFFAVLVSAFYLALGYFTFQRDREDSLLIYTFLGLALLFLVLAVPIQLDQHWVTMGWAIEGAILTWIGLRVGDRTSRYAALLVFVIAAFHWLLVDVHDFAYWSWVDFTPILNRRGLSCVVLMGAMAAAARFYRRMGAPSEDGERTTLRSLLLVGANALAVVLLSLDISDYFEQAKAASLEVSKQLEVLSSNKQLSLSILWVVYGGSALAIGTYRRLRVLRTVALVLLAVATLKVLAVDLRYYDAEWHTPILNQTFAAFALLVAGLACGAWVLSRSRAVEESEGQKIAHAMAAVANLLAVIALSAEASGFFEARMSEAGVAYDSLGDLRLAQQLSLSVIWTVYGGAMLAVGMLRRSLGARVMALLLLGLTILKVFLVDLAFLEKAYRIASFIVLGAILLVVSFLYQRYRQRTAGPTSTERFS